MNQSRNVKLVVFVPVSHADIVRTAMGQAGAGKIGNYSFCSFSTRGVGRGIPGVGTNPFIGSTSQLEAIEEERIETICSRDKLSQVMKAIRQVHPYEEVAFDIYSLEEYLGIK